MRQGVGPYKLQGPYHSGELLVQERAGETAIARRTGAIVSDSLPTGVAGFLERQRFAVLASVDADGRPWASAVVGEPGFAGASTPETVELDLIRAISHPEDPLWRSLRADPRLGTLFIDLATRRRFRINGTVETPPHASPPDHLRLRVDEAYGNCPKYIQARRLSGTARPESGRRALPARHGRRLETDHRRWIANADTAFVASVHPEGAADASHRGGAPGFIEVLDNHTLRIPDYPGNSMYNTLGNLAEHPVAGLLLLDFDRGATLQLTGRTELLWDLDPTDPVSRAATGGTGRAWTLTVEGWVESELPPGLTWELLDRSPLNPRVAPKRAS